MGQRGEGWVLAQTVLILGIFLGPAWSGAENIAVGFVGFVLMDIGVALALVGLVQLGRNLTPLPRPIVGGTLVTSGIYAWMRHPLYSGLVLVTLGFALMTMSLARIFLSALLFALLDAKSAQEEIWLVETYPEYAEYQQRVKKFLPGLF